MKAFRTELLNKYAIIIGNSINNINNNLHILFHRKVVTSEPEP